MKSFGAKVKEQRGNLGLSQKQLAEKAGMGIRTITSYELGERKPYQAQLYKLAKALEVSTEYLQNDNIEDPSYGLDRMEYVEDMRKNSGTRKALDLQKMLAENTALFAGGTLSEEAKDAYFQAVAEAYYDCKKAARKTFGKKKNPQ